MNFKAKDRRRECDDPTRQCQLVSLYLLDVFVQICEEKGLRYFLDSGTLLGAMRHNGFIPWDDDVDVCMPEDDYVEFLKIAPSILPDTVLLQKPGDHPQEYARCARLRDRKSFLCEWYTNVETPSGIFLDIFPFSKFPLLPKAFGKKLMTAYCTALFSEQAHRVTPSRGHIQMAFHLCASIAWDIIGMCIYAYYLMLRMTRPTVWNKKFGILVTSSPGIQESDLFPLSTHEFEGNKYFVPKDSEKYLSLMFGDWRTPPKESDRHGVHKTALILPTRAPDVWWSKNGRKDNHAC